MTTENENTVAKIRLPKALHRELRLIAADRRESVSAVARQIFRDALHDHAPVSETRKPD